MGNHEWDDDKIEQLLSNAPKIKDERSKDEILSRLKNDPRLIVPEKKKTWNKWIPASVSAAAVVTLGVLVSSFFDGNHSVLQETTTDNSAADTSEQEAEMKMTSEESSQPGILADGESEKENSIAYDLGLQDTYSHLAVYPADLEAGYRAFHLGFSSQAEAIPVTFLISNDKITQDFGDYDPTDLELYREYADDINENGFGFSEYHPMVGEFKEEDKLIIHTLPEDHPYDMGSASEYGYFQSIQYTFQDYEQLVVINQDGTQAEFAHTGLVTPVDLTKPYEKAAYYLYTLQNSQQLLVPFNVKHEDLQSALEAMKVAQGDYFQPVIPEYINFTVTEEKGLAKITFGETLDLQSMDPIEAGRFVDGILLTAAAFGMQAQFENVLQTEWNGFDFSQPLPVPIGTNRFYLYS